VSISQNWQQNLEIREAERQSYAQGRLWLGITCVGATILIAVCFLFLRIPHLLFNQNVTWSVRDVVELSGLFCGWTIFLVPFDFCGGYLLSRVFHRPQFATHLKSWCRNILLQGLFFLITATAILGMGRQFGVTGVFILLVVLQLMYIAFRLQLVQVMGNRLAPLTERKHQALKDQLKTWGYEIPAVQVVEHHDEGFTGGVCGLPGRETIVIPAEWCRQLEIPELATQIARRIEACRSGGYLRGILLASAWNLIGFALAVHFSGSGVQSVAGLVNVSLWYTLWIFVGLLILPAWSRHSTYAIDQRVLKRRIPEDNLVKALTHVQCLQGEASQRSRAIESVFYPVPSLQHRMDRKKSDSSTGAWNVARNMLFLSWAGMGFLSRAVHCNCGRPELWVMLPTD
jgi:hypothetical protein